VQTVVSTPSLRRRSLAALAASLAMSARPPGGRGARAAVPGPELAIWRAADGGFGAWQRDGIAVGVDGTLQLDAQTARVGSDPYPWGSYSGRGYYNGGAFAIGEAVSPPIHSSVGFREAIASWNATTPAGTWLEAQLRALRGDRWTKWFTLGIWAADESAVSRHSVARQGDDDGTVAVDTLRLSGRVDPAPAFQARLRLFGTGGAEAPSVRALAVSTSIPASGPPALVPGDPGLWDRELPVPRCSQMVYPDGGAIWCSPTSVSMVLGYWGRTSGPCEPIVRAAVDGVFDWAYDGHGNWPFNTAFAATHDLESYVARFGSLAQAEPWIAAGVPLIISFGWRGGELTGAPLPSSNGHLAVLAGFDVRGNPIVNDPAAPRDALVRRTYPRTQLERLWLSHSGGAAYVIYPPDWPVPPV
jgi:hypothetical protein